MGVGAFIMLAVGLGCVGSCLLHAFLPATRLKVVAVAASLPGILLALTAGGSWSLDAVVLYAVVFAAGIAGSTIGTGCAHGLRAIQRRLEW